MAKKASPAKPSVADDGAALVGSWIHKEENRLLRIQSGTIRIQSRNEILLVFVLEERDGRRVLLEQCYPNDEMNPLYEYQLRGDRLDLKLLPGAAAMFAELDENREILNDLGGTWYRVRINKDAEPAAAADGGA